MDSRDVEILKAVADLGDPSPERIGDATGIPASTVRSRLDGLREDGFVENDLYEIDAERLGLGVTVVSEVQAHYDEGCHRAVGRKLSGIEGVDQVYFTMGDVDFVVVARVADRGMVERLIADYGRIEEVRHTSSRLVVSTITNEPNPLRDLELETLLAVVDEG